MSKRLYTVSIYVIPDCLPNCKVINQTLIFFDPVFGRFTFLDVFAVHAGRARADEFQRDGELAEGANLPAKLCFVLRIACMCLHDFWLKKYFVAGRLFAAVEQDIVKDHKVVLVAALLAKRADRLDCTCFSRAYHPHAVADAEARHDKKTQ